LFQDVTTQISHFQVPNMFHHESSAAASPNT